MANWLLLTGLFSWGKKKEETRPTQQVKVEMPPGTAPAAAPVAEEQMDPLRRDLRFKGLHADVNPSQSVRPGEMTCNQCGRNFRYFSNANGVATTVRCPGCTKTYRV